MTPKTYVETAATPTQYRTKGSTAAQQFTAIGYGDTYPALDFKVQCDDLEDLKKCVKIVASYNEFNANEVCIALNKHLYFGQYWNANNPNNGRDLLKYKFAREYSPAIYVTFSHTNAIGNAVKVLTDREGTLIYTEEYSSEEFAKEFKRRCELFAKDTNADECDIKTDYNENGLRIVTYRFWWD